MTAVTLLGLPSPLEADARILIVDSEAAATRAQALLPSYCVLWPSEAGSLHELSMEAWIPLQGLDVLLWPSNIPACRDSMARAGNALRRVTDRVRMIYVNGVEPPYFSAADMGHDWDNRRVVAWAKERVRVFEEPPPAPDPMEAIAAAVELDPRETNDQQVIHRETPTQPAESPSKRVRRGKPRTKPSGQPPDGTQIEAGTSAFVSWEAMGLDLNGNGAPHPHLANIQRVLSMHPHMVGRIWYDEFHDKIFQKLFQDGTAEWADHHDTRLTIWMQGELRLARMGVQSVRLAVDEFAHLHPRNEPREWLESLQWDGTERLPCLMADGFGAPQNDYTAAVGRCFMVGMVARIYVPGAKVDYMPVFEGYQGIRKSSALDVIGGKFFAETHEDITKKDFLQNLRGKMLIEFSELHAFKRSEVERIKGIVTCRTDRYRDSYGRRAADRPRSCVFAGTTNRDDWVQDDTGARRFWPIACGEINLEYLRQVRELLFAEAVARFKKGESWWDIDPVLAKAEQDERRDADPWADAVLQWCSGKDRVRVSDILSLCLVLPLHMHGKVEQMRVASILRVAGWKRVTLRDRLVLFKGWLNPVVTVVTGRLDL